MTEQTKSMWKPFWSGALGMLAVVVVVVVCTTLITVISFDNGRQVALNEFSDAELLREVEARGLHVSEQRQPAENKAGQQVFPGTWNDQQLPHLEALQAEIGTLDADACIDEEACEVP